jgi:hypothetical protein
MAGAKAKSARKSATGSEGEGGSTRAAPSPAQRAYLSRGLNQPGGKLPLFDDQGREVPHETIRVCIARGWAEPWFVNPIKPDWVVAKLTPAGRRALGVDRTNGPANEPT